MPTIFVACNDEAQFNEMASLIEGRMPRINVIGRFGNMDGLDGGAKSRMLRTLLSQADIVVAIVKGEADAQTLVEVGAAWGIGRPVIAAGSATLNPDVERIAARFLYGYQPDMFIDALREHLAE